MKFQSGLTDTEREILAEAKAEVDAEERGIACAISSRHDPHEAATSFKGNQTHAMTREAAARARIFGLSHRASALCGTMVVPIGSDFDRKSAYACGNCKRVLARNEKRTV